MNLPAKDLPQETLGKKDWRESFHWRVFRIMAEFITGFQFLADFKKTITFFGSARLKPDNKWYKEAEKLGALLSKAGYSVVTGGGPGIMEAGNKGATKGKAESIGLNIQLPNEQRINPYVKKAVGFHYFFTRKVMLAFSAQAYVFFPGGFGTLDEVFEILTLVQTKKVEKLPIILVGQDFWSNIAHWLRDKLLKQYNTIDSEDLKIFKVVNTAEEAFAIIKKSRPRRD